MYQNLKNTNIFNTTLFIIPINLLGSIESHITWVLLLKSLYIVCFHFHNLITPNIVK